MLLAAVVVHGQTAPFDAIIRNGTVIDGSGNPRFDADIAIRNGLIVAIGTMPAVTAGQEIDARGMFVAPGFINIHSHASADALPTAINMLTQGVTTEIFNADGAGPLDVAEQMKTLAAAGLAENIGGYIGFNSIWQTVVGNTDRRPTPEEIERMRGLISSGLEQGAWGVSAGLDYKPGYFARTEEVIKVVDAAKNSRTNFTNHDRITPESNYSSKVGIDETVAIGEKAGLVPVVTHMKAQGREQGTAGQLLASMAQATKRGHYTAADAYPYLAGQSGLGSLIIPGWAQEGGRPEMLKRFADPAMRARIVKEAEEAMAARFGGPQGVYLPRTQQELTDVMKEMNASGGETIVRILEQSGDPGAILRFGAEEDLIKILQDPATSMACDCGASTATRVHPRFYGSFPRLLGRYVREQKIMSWEQAIKKSSWLPASTIGMCDRGVIALGMAADIVVFDPNTIIDRATYENPALPSEGVKHVFVNGVPALKDGAPTNTKSGRALLRTANMPSRPAGADARSFKFEGTSGGHSVAIDLTQAAGAREAKGKFSVDGVLYRPGFLQTTRDWASVGGMGDRAISVTVDQHGGTAVVVKIEELAQTPSRPALQSLAAADLDTFISRTVADQHAIGVTVGVMQDGKVIFNKGYGLASTGRNLPVTPTTLFAVGSVTKQFTCAVALQLEQEGKLSFDDRVSRYRADFGHANEITLRDLGNHVSGYRDYYPLDFVDRPMAKEIAEDDLLKTFTGKPLDFPPGSRYSYSNTGYLVLGHIASLVSRKPFDQLLQERIFTPLGMTQTRFEPTRGAPGLADGYTQFGLGPAEAAVPEGRGWIGAAGGIWSTPEDLMKWDLALMDGKVVNAKSWKTMTTPRALTDGRSSAYGCGQQLRDRGPLLVLVHSGGVSGFGARNAMIPATRSAVVVMANADYSGGVLDTIQEAVLAKLMPAASAPKITGAPARDAALDMLRQIRSGVVDRSKLSDEYNAFLTPQRLAAMSQSLKDAGEISQVEIGSIGERGGLEVSTLRMLAGTTPISTLMYRAPDGKIEEFLFSRR